MVGPTSAQKILLFGVGRTRPIHMGWAESGPAHTYSYCSHSTCNQTVAEAIDGRSEVGPCGGEGAAVIGLEWSWRRCWWKKWWRCWLLVAEEERRRKSAEGEGRPRGGCPYRWWGFGFVGRLSSRLLVEEKGFCGVFNGWRRGGEREKRNVQKPEKKLVFLLTLDPIFSSLTPWTPPPFIDSGRGKSCLHRGKLFNPWFGWEGSQPLAQSRHSELSNL